MFTQCPQCSTNFSISDHNLTAAGGKVQCGKCGEIFNALYTLSKHPMNDSGPVDSLQIASIDRLSNDSITQRYALSADDEPAADAAPAKPSMLKWGVLGLLLCATLIAQAGYFTPNQLTQHYPQLRPWLEQFCAITHCELARQHAPDKVAITHRDVRSHPTLPQALLISVTMKNEADFIQAYPQLKLSFFDLNHKQLATRTFRASEYLPQTVEIDQGFSAGATLSVALELIDPDKNAVNFEFDFK